MLYTFGRKRGSPDTWSTKEMLLTCTSADQVGEWLVHIAQGIAMNHDR